VIAVEELIAIGSTEGAAALGLETWDDVEVDRAHRSLAGVAEEDVPAAVVLGCSADVLSAA
jgi:hypothetical protein